MSMNLRFWLDATKVFGVSGDIGSAELLQQLFEPDGKLRPAHLNTLRQLESEWGVNIRVLSDDGRIYADMKLADSVLRPPHPELVRMTSEFSIMGEFGTSAILVQGVYSFGSATAILELVVDKHGNRADGIGVYSLHVTGTESLSDVLILHDNVRQNTCDVSMTHHQGEHPKLIQMWEPIPSGAGS